MSRVMGTMQASLIFLAAISVVGCGRIEQLNQNYKDLRTQLAESATADEAASQDSADVVAAERDGSEFPPVASAEAPDESDIDGVSASEDAKKDQVSKDAPPKSEAAAKDTCSNLPKTDPAKLVSVKISESNVQIRKSIEIPAGKSLLLVVEGSSSFVQYGIFQQQQSTHLHGDREGVKVPRIPAVCVMVTGKGSVVQALVNDPVDLFEVSVNGSMNKIFVDVPHEGFVQSFSKNDTGTSNQIKFRSYERERWSYGAAR